MTYGGVGVKKVMRVWGGEKIPMGGWKKSHRLIWWGRGADKKSNCQWLNLLGLQHKNPAFPDTSSKKLIPYLPTLNVLEEVTGNTRFFPMPYANLPICFLGGNLNVWILNEKKLNWKDKINIFRKFYFGSIKFFIFYTILL